MRVQLEEQLTVICEDIISILDKTLIPQNDQIIEKKKASKEKITEKDIESTVFYLKMKGDYHRYISEVDIV